MEPSKKPNNGQKSIAGTAQYCPAILLSNFNRFAPFGSSFLAADTSCRNVQFAPLRHPLAVLK
jgi:hypothetical protein